MYTIIATTNCDCPVNNNETEKTVNTISENNKRIEEINRSEYLEEIFAFCY